MSVEEASRKVFNDLVSGFERDTAKVFTAPKDREALADMISEWKRLGPSTLQKLSMNQPWNMPLYFALSATILNRREINELKKQLRARWLVPKIGTHPESSKQKQQNHHTDDPSDHQSAKPSPQPAQQPPENERTHADKQSTTLATSPRRPDAEPSHVEERRRQRLIRPTQVLRRLPVQHKAQHTQQRVHRHIR